jgi:aryl-phospho-beta-D-glucosidase BglC (GH1 family)
MRGYHRRGSWRRRCAPPTGGFVLIAVGFALLGSPVVLSGTIEAASGTPPTGLVAPLPPRRDGSSLPVVAVAMAPTAAPAPFPRSPGSSASGDVVPIPAARPPGPPQPGSVTPLPSPRPPPALSFARGVNLPAPSFNAPEYVPGVYGTNYIYPTGDDLDYFISKGFTLFRLPFSWERMQPTLGAPLDATQLGYLDTFIAAAHARNVRVVLDQQNFDRYRVERTPPPYDESENVVVGSTAAVPITAFADFWRKMATHYASETAIAGYDLTNEPHDTGGRWPATAQAATTAIRQVDHAHTIIVEGENYAAASTWTAYNEHLNITDPDNNLIYSAHEYFDADGSGTYVGTFDAEGGYPMLGVDRAAPFIDWLQRHGVRGYFGEYGVPNTDARWLTVLDNFLAALDAARLDGTYWAGGPFLDGYPLSINPDPVTGQDAPQMETLVRHLSR